MTYSIQLPDGTVVNDIPDNVPPVEAKRKLIAKFPELAKIKPTEPQTTVGGQVKEFFKGIPAGATNLLEQAGIGLSSAIPPESTIAAREFVEKTAAPIKEYFKAAPGYEETVSRKIAEGVGSTVPFFLLGPMGAAGRVAGTVLGAGAGRGEAQVRAEQEGATPEQVRSAAAAGTAIGLSEMFAPGVGDQIKKLITRAFVRGGAEGAQEAAAQIAQNLTAKGIYKPDQPIIEGAGEAGAYGFGVGALSSALIDMALGRRAARPAPRPTEGEKLNKEGEQVAQEILDPTTPAKPVDQVTEETKAQQNAAVVQGAQQADINIQAAQQAAAINQAAQQIIEQPAPIINQEVQSGTIPDTEETIGEGVGTSDEISSGPRANVPAGESTTPESTGVAVSDKPVVQPDEGEAPSKSPLEERPKQRKATVKIDETGHGIAFNESVLAGTKGITADSDMGEDYPSRVGAIMITGIDRQAGGQKGRASEVLKTMTDWADANNKQLVLMPAASGDLKKDDLISWYSRNGFVQESDGAMVRQPKKETPSATTPTTEETKEEKKQVKQEEKRKQKQLEEAKKVAEASQQVLPTSTGAVTPVETPIVETPVVEETKAETPTTPSTPTTLDPEVAKQVEAIRNQIIRRDEKGTIEPADANAVYKLIADPTPENLEKARQIMRETTVASERVGKGKVSKEKKFLQTKELNEEAKEALLEEKEGEVEIPGVLYRGKTEKAAGMNVDVVEKLVDQIVAKWKNAPVIDVVDKVSDLPKRLRIGSELQPGLFDPVIGRVFIIASNLDSEIELYNTILHETIGHYGLRSLLGDKYKSTMLNLYNSNKRVKGYVDEEMELNPKLTKEVAVEEFLAAVAERNLVPKPNPLDKVLGKKIIQFVRNLLRRIFGERVDTLTDKDFLGLVADARALVQEGAPTGKYRNVSEYEGPLYRKGKVLTAPIVPDQTFEEALESSGARIKQPTPLWKRLMSKGGRQDIIKKLQNDRIYAKRIEDEMDLFGKAIYAGDKKNAFYTYIIRSSSIAQALANERLKPIEAKIQNYMDEYVRASGKSLPDAIKHFDIYAQAEHDFERRVVKYILFANNKLREEYDPNIDKNKMSPADEYKDIMGRYAAAANTKDAEALRKRMNDLLFDKLDIDKGIATPKAQSYKTDLVKTSPDALDVNSNLYIVSGKTTKTIDDIKANMIKDPNIEIYNKMMKVIREELQPATKELNSQANYWTKPVENTAAFYGYKHYVPLKGKPGIDQKINDDLELTGRNLGGEGQDIEIGMEGRLTNPDNAILQSMADAYKGALRAGRAGFFDALANAAAKSKLNPDGQDILVRKYKDKNGQERIIPMARVTENVKFADRRTLEDVKNIKGVANIFRYREDGSIDVIKIDDPKLAEAIRRTYRTTNPFWDRLNEVTSLIAQGHTRYNPSFAPVNFIADVFTNAYTIGAEMGPKKSLDMLWAVATDMGTNGLMYKTGKFAKLYNEGNFKELRTLAAQDPYYAEVLEYIEQGGKVSYLQGLAAKGQLNELMKDIGPSKIVRTKASIDKVFDIYTDAFELASRVAAYRIAKSQYLSEGLNEDSAKVKAAVYAKNLANFETIGQWGKELGGLFMFGRQAMTGAVRAVDALSNAMSFDEAQFRADAENKGYTKEETDKAVKTKLEKQKNARLTSMALLGAGAVAYMLAFLGADDDDQGRNRVATDDMSRWVRNLRIPIPGTEQFLQIRWGFGLGAFASAGAQIAGAFTSNTPLEDTFFNIISAGFESFAGLPVSKINMFENFPAFVVDSITPSVIRPFFEYAMNMDGLGREIYSNRTTRYGDAYTGGDNIPEMYKSAARFLADITNGAIDWSPNTMYFFANNYFDAISRYANYASGLAMVAASSKELSPKDIPIVESFLGSKSNVDAREFAKVEDKIKEMERKLKMFEANPNQYARYVESHPMHLAIVDIYNKQINGTLRDLNTQANLIRRTSDFTPKERGEILEDIKFAQNITKRYMLEMFKELNVEPGFLRGSGD